MPLRESAPTLHGTSGCLSMPRSAPMPVCAERRDNRSAKARGARSYFYEAAPFTKRRKVALDDSVHVVPPTGSSTGGELDAKTVLKPSRQFPT